MKIATYNVDNLFHRDKSLVTSSLNKSVLNWFHEMEYLMRRVLKSPRDLDRIKELSFLLGFERAHPKTYAIMRKRGGELYLRGSVSSFEDKASCLSKWYGWLPVQTVPINPFQH